MRGSPENLAVLRNLLAERFPAAASRSGGMLATEIAAIDEVADGGLPAGALTEIVSAQPSSGGQLLILRLLERTRLERGRAALVDGLDAFDPDSHETGLLEHLVWARCRTCAEALHAADILAHDANLALLLLDLRGFETADLRRVPSTAWYRLQRAIARSDTVMVVLTTWPLVGSATLRFTLAQGFHLDQLDELQAELAQNLSAEMQRRRLIAQGERRSA